MTDDVRFAFRQLRKNPGLAAIAVITLVSALARLRDVRSDSGRSSLATAIRRSGPEEARGRNLAVPSGVGV